jgi:hypothetical protein
MLSVTLTGQRAPDDSVHVRATDEIGERVPHPVDLEPPLDAGHLHAPDRSRRDQHSGQGSGIANRLAAHPSVAFVDELGARRAAQ